MTQYINDGVYIHEILHNIIFDYLEVYDKHTFQKINKYTKTIHIKDLSNINSKYLKNINDNIIKTYKYVTILYAQNNPNITNIKHMIKLKKIDAFGLYC